MSYDVFISYNPEDLNYAEIFYHRLIDEDFSVWFDKARLKPEFDWYTEIKQSCENSRVFLPILTPRWKEFLWNKFETYEAKTVIPLMVEGVWEDISTPPLQRFQAEKLDFTNFDKADWQQLFASLRKLLAHQIPQETTQIISLKYFSNPFFIGREYDLVHIHEELHCNSKTGLTQGCVRVIVALGGVGKTTLAHHYADKFWRYYPQIFWVDARTGYETEFAHIYDLLFPNNINIGLKDNDKAARALHELNSQEVRLLILDNVEDEKSVQQWIPKTGGCHTLITSRYAKWSVAIKSLTLQVLDPESAIRFLQCRSAHEANGTENSVCKTLAKKLGYLPLALEQAAAYIEQQGGSFGFVDYLQRYEKAAQELLVIGALGSTAYPDPVITTWRPTVSKLSPGARAILRLASFLDATPIPLKMFIDAADIVQSLTHALFNEMQVEEQARIHDLGKKELPNLLRKKIMEFLTSLPNVHGSNAQLAFLHSIGLDSGLQNQINITGSPVEFFQELIQTLSHYGKLRDGRNALEALLESAKDYIGMEGKEYCTTLIQELRAFLSIERLPPPQPSNTIEGQTNWDIWIRSQVGQLKAYSMVKFDGQSFIMHPLVQTVERLGIPEQEKNHWIEQATEILFKNAPEDADLPHTWSIWRELYPHVLSLHSYAEKINPKLRILILDALARFTFGNARYHESVKFERKAFEIAESTYGPDSEEVEARLLNYGESLRELEQFEEAETMFRRCLAWREKRYGHDHALVATCYNYLGLLLRVQDKDEEAQVVLEEGLHICERCEITGGRTLIKLLLNQGRVLLTLEQLDKAEDLLQRALNLAEKEFGEDDLLTLFALGTLAVILNNKGAYSQAETLFKRALEGFERLLESEHPYTIECLSCLASLYINLNNLDLSEKYRHTAVERKERVYGVNHPETLTELHKLSDVLIRKGEPLKAEPYCRKTFERCKEVLGDSHPDTLSTLSLLVLLLTKLERIDEAKSLNFEHLSRLSVTECQEKPEIAVDLNNLALEFRDQENFDEAELLLRKALEIEQMAYPADHPKLPHRMNNLTFVLLLQDKREEANTLNRKAWTLKSNTHDITSMRILFMRIILCFLAEKQPEHYYGQMKTLLSNSEIDVKGNIVTKWNIAKPLEFFRPKLTNEQYSFLEALLEVLNDITKLPSLDCFSFWNAQARVSLSELWPDD